MAARVGLTEGTGARGARTSRSGAQAQAGRAGHLAAVAQLLCRAPSVLGLCRGAVSARRPLPRGAAQASQAHRAPCSQKKPTLPTLGIRPLPELTDLVSVPKQSMAQGGGAQRVLVSQSSVPVGGLLGVSRPRPYPPPGTPLFSWPTGAGVRSPLELPGRGWRGALTSYQILPVGGWRKSTGPTHAGPRAGGSEEGPSL